MNKEENIKHLPKDEKVKKQFGLITAIAFIVGNVVGSGIFFKTDNILVATGGNVLLGVLLFCLAAISIIFGSLSLAELAARTDDPGGLMNYADAFINPGAGSAYGWFITCVYIPTSNVVVAWVAGIYTCQFLGLDQTLEMSILIGTIWILLVYAINMISARLGGYFANLTTLIKMIPLIAIGILGFSSGNTATVIMSNTAVPSVSSWLFTIPAIAYSFDGWIVSCSISHEIKHSKRNLPLALVIAPLVILALYLLYFVGFSVLVGPRAIMSMGDSSLYYAGRLLFGNTGEKVMLFLIIISVVGTLNGQSMALMQMPYALAIRRMFPGSKYLEKTDKSEYPLRSSVCSFIITMVWMLIHFLVEKYGWLQNSDVSEIPTVLAYALCIPLYFKVIELYRKGKASWFRGLICPILAIFGSLIIFSGILQNLNFILFIVLCLVFLPIGWIYYKDVTLKQQGVTDPTPPKK